MKPISKLKKCVARSIYDERENVNDRFGEIANKKKKDRFHEKVRRRHIGTLPCPYMYR